MLVYSNTTIMTTYWKCNASFPYKFYHVNDTAYLFPSNENDMDGEIEDLLAYFHQQLTLQDNSLKICVPEMEMTQMHISGRVFAIVRREKSTHPITLKKLCWQLSCYHSGLLRCTRIQSHWGLGQDWNLSINRSMNHCLGEYWICSTQLVYWIFCLLCLYTNFDGLLYITSSLSLSVCSFGFLSTALPPEVLIYIFRWVVSSDLDLRALEQLSLVCRGFYICARSDQSLQIQHILNVLATNMVLIHLNSCWTF